ncbi:Signal transduction histidine kinase [Alteromonadaceae bacterium Bs31]|nr:Signal transduction histidine kinase [Alteromonadaceae bacterium Bs31]
MRNLSVSLIVVVIASIIAFGWILNQIYIHSSPVQNASENATQVKNATEVFAVVNASEGRADFIKHWNSNSEIKLSVIALENFPLPVELESSFSADKPLVLESDEGISIHFPLKDGGEILAISIPEENVVAQENNLELILTLSFYAGVTTIILIWIWPLIHQLARLRDAAVHFGKGDLGARVKLARFSYIREIETEFNRMADRIQSLINDNKLLSRAVSHDLKTPVARLRFGLDALTETESEDQRKRYAERVNRDLEEMESLIETLLQYARLDESRIQLAPEPIGLSKLVDLLVQTQISDGLELDFDNQVKYAQIRADKRYITMLINNLLSNALRHANHQVKVSLVEMKARYILSFEDDGQGIPDDERENAIKPFWRGKKGRGQKGHGMGLAIVSRIAEWHGATLDISDSKALGGACVSLSFSSYN